MTLSYKHPTVKDVRQIFVDLLANGEFVTDKTGVKCIEIVSANFVADEPTIFGSVNNDYVLRELAWYLGQSLFVESIPGKTPAIWEEISSQGGKINSNYGWCIFSEENGYQFYHAAKALIEDKFTRRSVMVYTRPSIQKDYNQNGMSDFICTDAVQLLIRDNQLQYIVKMRSNDSIFGYKNDFAWHDFVMNMVLQAIRHAHPEVHTGRIIWNAGSLHVYERHFDLVKLT